MNKRYLLLLTFISLSAVTGQELQPAAAAALTSYQPLQSQESKPTSTETDSEEVLRAMIKDSGGSEEMIIRSLEGYLAKYPRSGRRQEIEEQIYQLAVKVGDRDRIISYGDKLVIDPAAEPNRIDLLTTLVSSLRARRGSGDLTRALGYADQLVTDFEKLIAGSRKPGRLSRLQWQEQKDQGLASVYLVRGRVLAELDQPDRAVTDLRRSYELYPLAGSALTLSEVYEKQQRQDESLRYAVLAFVLGHSGDEQLDLRSIRRRMGALYTARNKSEKGLGDLFLESWDKFIRDRDERQTVLDPSPINAGVTDPLLFKLTRTDGSTLAMSTLRGKVIVLNFWATWCGPCRTELPLFRKTIEKYQKDSGVAFLAVTTDQDRDLVKPYLANAGYTLPVVFAENIDEHFKVSSIPTTIILDSKGQVAFRMRGFNPNDDFVARLSEKIEMARK